MRTHAMILRAFSSASAVWTKVLGSSKYMSMYLSNLRLRTARIYACITLGSRTISYWACLPTCNSFLTDLAHPQPDVPCV